MSTAFANRITSMRKEKGLSQKEVAMNLGVSQALLSHYEKGVRECGLDFVVRCADYFGVTTDYLLGKQDSKYGLLNEEEKYHLLESPNNGQIDMQLVLLCINFFAEKVKRPVDEIYGDKLMWSSAIALYKLIIHGINKGHVKKEWFNVDIRNDDFVFQKIVDLIWTGIFVNDSVVIGQLTDSDGKHFPEAFNSLIKSVEVYITNNAERYINAARKKLDEID